MNAFPSTPVRPDALARHPHSEPSTDPATYIARVTAVDRGQYLISSAAGESPAKLAGKMLFAHQSADDLPCVGDWVRVRHHAESLHASMIDVLPRTSWLRRKRPGDSSELQMIAANIDVAFIMQSCHGDFNVRRLERYLVMARDGRIDPVILLTKSDLLTATAAAQHIAQIRQAGIEAPIVLLSQVSGEGLAALGAGIEAGKTYCLLGSSGVGKTTLANYLLGSAALTTGAVSLSGEGRHTTTRRQFLTLPSGGLLIDMPGMRELGMLGMEEGIGECFSDIQQHARGCRFRDCTHSGEPGCAVQTAIADGALDAASLQHYHKLKKESDFHQMSHLEKRKKDKAFGKQVKAASQGRKTRDME